MERPKMTKSGRPRQFDLTEALGGVTRVFLGYLGAYLSTDSHLIQGDKGILQEG